MPAAEFPKPNRFAGPAFPKMHPLLEAEQVLDFRFIGLDWIGLERSGLNWRILDKYCRPDGMDGGKMGSDRDV
jgi:hypothetical protein